MEIENLKSVDYVISDKDFFNHLNGGRGAHALGVIDGLSKNGLQVNLLMPLGANLPPQAGFRIITYSTFNTGIPLLDKIISAFKSIKKASLRNSDVLLIRKNIYFLLVYLLTFGLAFKSNVQDKIVWEVNGFSLERYKGQGFLHLFYKVNLFLHKIMFRNCRAIYVVTPFLKAELTKGIFPLVDAGKVHVVSNGSPSSAIGRSYPQSTLHKNNIHIVFIGVLQDYNDFSLIVDSIYNFNCNSQSKIQFHIIGHGKNEKFIKKLSNKFDFVHCYGQLNRTEFRALEFINEYTLGIIPLKNNDGVRFLSPIKAYEYAAMGLPIIASDNTQIERGLPFILSYKAGDSNSFMSCLSKVENIDNYQKLSQDALQFSKENSWRERMKSLLSSI